MARYKKTDELNSSVEIQEGLEKETIESLDEPYKPKSQLYIPEEARELYRSKGYELQWVRIFTPRTTELDSTNIIAKEADLYSFVPREEIPGINVAMSSYFKDRLDQSHNGLYVVGELALAKVPIKRLKEKRKYLDNLVKSRHQAIIGDLRKANALPSTDRGEGWKIEVPASRSRDADFG